MSSVVTKEVLVDALRQFKLKGDLYWIRASDLEQIVDGIVEEKTREHVESAVGGLNEQELEDVKAEI